MFFFRFWGERCSHQDFSWPSSLQCFFVQISKPIFLPNFSHDTILFLIYQFKMLIKYHVQVRPIFLNSLLTDTRQIRPNIFWRLCSLNEPSVNLICPFNTIKYDVSTQDYQQQAPIKTHQIMMLWTFIICKKYWHDKSSWLPNSSSRNLWD